MRQANRFGATIHKRPKSDCASVCRSVSHGRAETATQRSALEWQTTPARALLEARFEHHVEGALGGPPDVAKAGVCENLR